MSGQQPHQEIGLVLTPTDGPDVLDPGAIKDLYDRVLAVLRQHIEVNSLVDDRRTPWAMLRRKNKPPVLMFFYQDLALNATRAANEINRLLLDPDAPLGLSSIAVQGVAAFPNRATKSVQIDSDGGGPGSPPRPVPNGEIPVPGSFGKFHFAHPLLEGFMTNPPGAAKRPVTVAVFDSWPPDPNAGPANWLKTAIGTRLASLDPIPPVAGSAHPIPIKVARPNIAEVTSVLPDMPDHGLFVAGIIHSIAPQVPIQVVRVLNDNTAGDVESTFKGLEALETLGLLDNDLLILNLSLRFSPPGLPLNDPSGDVQTGILELLFQVSPDVSVAAVAVTLAAALFGAMPAGGDFYKLVIEVLFWLFTIGDNVLVVTAAGNDGNVAGAHPPEAAPGSYGSDLAAFIGSLTGTAKTNVDSVVQCAILSVAACSADRTNSPLLSASDFSNQGDIVTLGGDVVNHPYPVTTDAIFQAIQLRTIPVANVPDAVVGAGTLDQHGIPHDTGWISWAGTSFATAIVTGVAAAIAAHNQVALSAEELRLALDTVRNGTVIPALGSQPIETWQER